MKHLLVVTAVIEAGAGAALVGFPSETLRLLLGPPVGAPPSMALVRAAGAVLLALGIACWITSRNAWKRAARGMVTAMTVYNPSVAIALGAVGMRAPPVGILLWPAVVLHAAMTVWCIVCLIKKRSNV